jgi:hypothetical protein
VKQLDWLQSVAGGWRSAHLLGLVHLERRDRETAVKLLEEASAGAHAQAATNHSLAQARAMPDAEATGYIGSFIGHTGTVISVAFAPDGKLAFSRLPPSQWRSARTTNAIERLHEEFKRRIKAETVLPSADTAAMLFWALLASGQINTRKVDRWQTLATKPIDQPIDLPA